jgi:hypothetical protein
MLYATCMGRTQERIRFKTEVLKVIILVTLAIGGGSASLFLGEQTPLRLFFATLGVVGSLGLVLTALLLYQGIMRLIDRMKEEA